MVDPRKVFDHFYTTKPVGKGTGLGLSISHAVVTGHGGTISARNNPEGGACFTITLPVHVRERMASPPPAVAAGASPLQLASALVVDDEPSVLEYQMEILRSLGVAPVAARSGDEAMACIGRQRFEVIVSDLRMPGGMSGPDLFAWVEQHHPDLAARFVFVTGDTVSEATREFLKHAGRPYLMKPFDVKEYVDALRAARPTQPIS
jgi:CheY-like chemotaxis protein